VSNSEPYDWRTFPDTPQFIAELPHTVALVSRRQRFQGRSIVWLKERYDGLSDVPKELRDASMDEMLRVAEAIQQVFKPTRMNYACYGNIVPQVHWHLIPRYTDDPDWNGPPRLRQVPPPLSDEECVAMAARIRNALETGARR